MLSAGTRKHFNEPFKAQVALEAIRAGQDGEREIAQEYGVHPTQMGQWKKELHEQEANIFVAKRGPKPDDPSANPERRYSWIGWLKMELDWLNKILGSPSPPHQASQITFASLCLSSSPFSLNCPPLTLY